MTTVVVHDKLRIAPEVQSALADHAPVVALETTIVTHGMPYPENVATARSLEEGVRRGGATPATFAVIGGIIRAGVTSEELEWLGSAKDVLKLSRNDLAYAIASREHGSTTVAATMICAHLAGIRVFATGGIGGVHRGAEASFDISADLEELASTPVAVVCAGAKALLDLPKTLEYLETRGVPVIGYRTGEFPAFWSRSSGLPVPIRLESAAEIADSPMSAPPPSPQNEMMLIGSALILPFRISALYPAAVPTAADPEEPSCVCIHGTTHGVL